MLRFGALVLCGGRSQRIGKNKAYLLKDNEPFISIIVNKLSEIFEEVVIAVDETQKYTQIINNRVKVVEDKRNYYGPIEGLRQGLKISQKDYIFVCGCDMPNISKDCIIELAGYIDYSYQCILPFIEKPQVLHGFYSKSLYTKIESGSYFSIKGLLDDVKVKYVSKFNCNIKESVININTKEDYIKFLGGANG
ncbi:MAG: molybdenum cofactor guanylyltransferase [Desulfurella sp.]|uniref:molybdenum cofactor guanylyltransferase n=1 Tax=Desulfurella sp. TaxID=1962857 RepID=UPI003D129C72